MQRLSQNCKWAELPGVRIKFAQQGLEWICYNYGSGTLGYRIEIKYHNSRGVCIEGAIGASAYSTQSSEIGAESPAWSVVCRMRAQHHGTVEEGAGFGEAVQNNLGWRYHHL